jgi:hypothetical protein
MPGQYSYHLFLFFAHHLIEQNFYVSFSPLNFTSDDAYRPSSEQKLPTSEIRNEDLEAMEE